jgi:catechol 2,3-dioxygenase-like lactoylglutathione lyase family enzyme
MLSTHSAFPMIAVRNLAQARAFYEGVLGLPSLSPKDDGHVAMFETGGGKLAVYVSQFAGTNRATAASWEVADVEAEVEALKGRGVEFEHYDLPGAARKGDVHVSDGLKNAWFKDPEGNILGIVGR